MTKRYSIAEARANLPGIVDEVEGGHPIELTRRGKPVAVVLSGQDYARLRSERPHFKDAYRRFLRRFQSGELEIGPDAFEGLRDTGVGRQVKL